MLETAECTTVADGIKVHVVSPVCRWCRPNSSK